MGPGRFICEPDRHVGRGALSWFGALGLSDSGFHGPGVLGVPVPLETAYFQESGEGQVFGVAFVLL